MDTPDGRLLNPGHGERIHLGLGAKVGLGTKAGLEDQSGPREPKRASRTKAGLGGQRGPRFASPAPFSQRAPC